MKATFEFDMNDDDDKAAVENLVSRKGDRAIMALNEFEADVLRRYRKYGIPFADLGIEDQEAVATKLVEAVSDAFYEILENRDLKI